MIILKHQAKDQIVIDELSTHTDVGRQELIHPYKVRRSSQTRLGVQVLV